MEVELHLIPLKGRYSDSLRDMFKKINPYNLSCLYKENFEEHAIKTLLSCDGIFPQCGSLQDPSNRISGAKICSSDTCKTFSTECKTKSPGRHSPLLTMEYFYQQMRNLITEKADSYSEVSGWKICGKTHVDSIDHILKHLNEPLPVYKRRQSSAGKQRCMTTIRRNRHLNGNQSNSSVFRKMSLPSSVSDEIVGKLLESRSEKTSNNACLNISKAADHSVKSETNNAVSVTKRQGHTTRSAGPIYCHADSESENVISCRQGRSRSQYLEHYRHYLQRSPQNSIGINKSASKGGLPISKARVHCQDVRSGACIQPAIKVAQFKFKVNCRWRTVSGSKSKKDKTPTGAAKSPYLPVTQNTGSAIGVAALQELQSLHITSPVNNTATHSVTACTPSPPITHTVSPGPFVCRSRPSIPSNARGMVCDTAVETPPHVIQCVKGHSINSRHNPSDKSQGILMSYLEDGHIRNRSTRSTP